MMFIGTEIIKRGDSSSYWYIITKGQVRVSTGPSAVTVSDKSTDKDKKQSKSTININTASSTMNGCILGIDAYFGEESILFDCVQRLSVFAISNVEAIRMSHENFNKYVNNTIKKSLKAKFLKLQMTNPLNNDPSSAKFASSSQPQIITGLTLDVGTTPEKDRAVKFSPFVEVSPARSEVLQVEEEPNQHCGIWDDLCRVFV